MTKGLVIATVWSIVMGVLSYQISKKYQYIFGVFVGIVGMILCYQV